MGWGSTIGVFYCSALILRRYVCLVRRQCLMSYYVNGSGSITSVGEERANLSAVVYL